MTTYREAISAVLNQGGVTDPEVIQKMACALMDTDEIVAEMEGGEAGRGVVVDVIRHRAQSILNPPTTANPSRFSKAAEGRDPLSEPVYFQGFGFVPLGDSVRPMWVARRQHHLDIAAKNAAAAERDADFIAAFPTDTRPLRSLPKNVLRDLLEGTDD